MPLFGRKKQEPESAHPSEERRPVHPRDIELRAAGFKIHSRSKSGGAMWSRDGNVYRESAAYQVMLSEQV